MFLSYLLNNIIIILVFIWYNSKIFSYKKHDKRKNTILVIIILLAKSYLNLQNNPQFNLIMSLLTYFLITKILFNSSTLKNIFFNGCFLAVSFVSELFAYVFLEAIVSLNVMSTHTVIYQISSDLISFLLIFLFSLSIVKTNDIKKIVENKKIWYFSVFPIFLIISIYAINSLKLMNSFPLFCLLFIIGIILLNIIVCLGFTNVIQLQNMQIENEKLKTQELHYQLIEEKFENSKQFIHDIKKHTNLITMLFESNDYDKLGNYLEELNTEILREESFIISGNQLIDLIVYSKKTVLEMNSIVIKYDIKIKDIPVLTTLDFNVIFSNILDNAIESCIKSKEKFVKIKLDQVDDIVVLEVINSCDKINQNLKTSKNNEFHGYGLKNIQKIAKKYNLICNFNYDVDNNLFTSTLFIK